MSNPHSKDRLKLEWSEWISLKDKNALKDIPSTSGLYRIRFGNQERLKYIGESKNLHSRLRTHASCYRKTQPDNWPASRLWELRQECESAVEVSYSVLDENTRKRRSMEAALIALYRREKEESPTCNFGKRATDSISPLDWVDVCEVSSDSWMGLEWTEPERLGDLLPNTPLDDSVPAQPGVYRLWWSEDVPPLAKIGEAFRLRRRLHEHRRSKDGNLLFSYARICKKDGGYESHKRKEIETELLGAHRIACGEAPKMYYNG